MSAPADRSLNTARSMLVLGSLFVASLGTSLLLLGLLSPLPAWQLLATSGLLAGIVTALSAWLGILPAQRHAERLQQQLGQLDLLTPDEIDSLDGPLRALAETLLHKHREWRRLHADTWQIVERLHGIFEHSDQAIFILDAGKGLILDCNPKVSALLGQPQEQLLGKALSELVEQPQLVAALIGETRQRSHERHEVLVFRTPGSGSISLDLSISHIDSGSRQLLILMGRDSSEREDAELRIHHLAYHDTLTDLPNRTLLTDRVNRALKRTRRSRQIGALLFLDLDNFKRINDSLGHSVGDLLLRELAARLQHSLREEDTISRLGGDEFVVLIEHLGTDQERAERQIHEIADKVRHLLAEAYELNGHELHVTGSIGYVTFPRDGETMETLLRHADLAMYQAKKAGRNTVTRFDIEMDERAAQRMRVESEVRNAMRDGNLQLYFQPVLRIRDGRMLGAEALLRWVHPQDGEITPEHFLPQIEDSALMLHLADWVLREVCLQQARIARDRALYTPDYLAINISHQQFHQPNFVEQVQQVIEETGADPRRILFEITETVIMNNTHDARQRMLALKQMGFRFAIDDFGTGYSSLSYLKQLPADTLKIDKSFVQDLATDVDDAAIVRTILGIADHMGMRVIAEGVENYEQLQFLRNNHCAYYQGFLGRPPLPLQQFLEDLQHSQFLRVVE